MTDAKFSVPAAQYLRMSTEHQQYSLDNQSAAIQKYADSHGFTVVRTYSDPAKSGLVRKELINESHIVISEKFLDYASS
jgi:DNA invertase Pin-like site-specific DNA recombinase